LRTKLELTVVIYFTIPEKQRTFLWVPLRRRISRKAVSMTFERNFDEHIQIGSILPVNVWGRGTMHASAITMSPMILKIEGERRIQYVPSRVSTEAEYRYNVAIPGVELARADLKQGIANILAEQGFSRVGEVDERDCGWDEGKPRYSASN
jgi:hypothetical protein